VISAKNFIVERISNDSAELPSEVLFKELLDSIYGTPLRYESEQYLVVYIY
jgi:hypothetical protein